MNKYLFFLFCNLIVLPDVFAESLLKATKFPETFNDLPFVERVDILKKGYEPYETIFDANDVCIQNCAYKGLTLKEEKERIEKNTQSSLLESLKWDNYTIADIKNVANRTDLSKEHKDTLHKYVGNSTVYNNIQTLNTQNENNMGGCPVGKHRDDIPYNERSPKHKPVLNVGISSPFGERRDPVNPNNKKFHSGIDYAAEKDTPVYATAWGQVTFAGWINGFGYTVQLQHIDKTISMYAHLNTILVAPGSVIPGGCIIALSGNTGKSVGKNGGYHLHYSIISNGEWVNPEKYIQNN